MGLLLLLLGLFVVAVLRVLVEGVTMAPCVACRKSISKKATICPYCHTKTPAGVPALAPPPALPLVDRGWRPAERAFSVVGLVGGGQDRGWRGVEWVYPPLPGTGRWTQSRPALQTSRTRRPPPRRVPRPHARRERARPSRTDHGRAAQAQTGVLQEPPRPRRRRQT